MSNFNLTYKQVVDAFELACRNHKGIATFETGTLDFLDAVAVNKQYPYIFMRPIGSNYADKIKTLTFELFSLDIPKVSDESPVKIMSNCEERIWQIISYFMFGTDQKYWDIVVTSITPVNEAFQDRVFGWVATIDVNIPFKLDYCHYPS
jgi:hypothetical protein